MFRLLPLLAVAISANAAEPIRLLPANPHYFLFRGRPTVLVTSGEHYGAVINRDFNYVVYLDELKRHGLNNTRTWAGAYREVAGDFSIANNTLAPQPGRFLCPWPRTSTSGAADGANKFDLSQWDPEYFARLKDFVREAGRRGVVVEMNLFCPYYRDSMWNVSPLNARNNVNGVGDVPRTEALTMKHAPIVKVQEAMARKIAAELRDFDNLYYEICNEPYFGGVTLDWQEHIAGVIADAERDFPQRHLISQNIANGSVRIEKPFAAVSLFNFHYSRPPESVAMNYALSRAIGNNETGFDGDADATYRVQGWDFLMAGGALYNNLDYSFTVGHERGDFRYTSSTPGGGSAALRAQLGILRDFFDAMPFVRMAPASDVIRSGVPEGASARVLAERGKVYAIYIHHGRPVKDAKPKYQVDGKERRIRLALDLPLGSWRVSWINTKTGRIDKRERVVILESPAYTEDVALRITAR